MSTRREIASDTLRIARNWLIEAAERLEALNDTAAGKNAKELRSVALTIADWRSEMTNNIDLTGADTGCATTTSSKRRIH